MPTIFGKHKDCAVERIDSFPTMKEAEKMLVEYRMAFGKDFQLWIGKKYPIPQEDPCQR